MTGNEVIRAIQDTLCRIGRGHVGSERDADALVLGLSQCGVVLVPKEEYDALVRCAQVATKLAKEATAIAAQVKP